MLGVKKSYKEGKNIIPHRPSVACVFLRPPFVCFPVSLCVTETVEHWDNGTPGHWDTWTPVLFDNGLGWGAFLLQPSCAFYSHINICY